MANNPNFCNKMKLHCTKKKKKGKVMLKYVMLRDREVAIFINLLKQEIFVKLQSIFGYYNN